MFQKEIDRGFYLVIEFLVLKDSNLISFKWELICATIVLFWILNNVIKKFFGK